VSDAARDMEWPSEFDSVPPTLRGWFDAHGRRLEYLLWAGDGQPVLLLHGIASSAWSWWRVAPLLAARGHRVLALDMPGHGASDASDDHRIEAVARMAGAALALPELQGAAVIGHSWGGAVALAIASGAHGGPLPTRVVLIDPVLGMTPEIGAAALPRYGEGVGAPVGESLARLQAAEPGWHPGDYYAKAVALQQAREAAVHGFFTQSGTWYLVPRLAELPMPLLLIAADPLYSVIRPDVLAAAEAALRPGLGQLVVIPGARHTVFRGEVEPFLRVVCEWLEA
jgi:pimeloyl-ACP methyl ester carboxylesterase